MSAASSISRAIRRREVRAWFGNPASYVFVAFFVLLSATALFQDQFFRANQATLDTWNEGFPLLLALFAPLVTMGLWANERRSGTEELLLTLPASDWQVVWGKYLAAIQIYSFTLLFTLPLVGVLMALGNPDLTLLAGNYVGYWLFGVALLGAGLVGSQLSENMTVAFIMGLLLCLAVVFAEEGASWFLGSSANRWIDFLPGNLFASTGRGIFSPGVLVVFLGLSAAFAYLNLILLSRRHWNVEESRLVWVRVLIFLGALVVGLIGRGKMEESLGSILLGVGGALALAAFLPWSGKDFARDSYHGVVRFLFIVVATVGFTVAIGQSGVVIDTTHEAIHSLSEDTEKLVGDLDENRPVTVEAFISTEVPREYVKVRRDLTNLLQRYDHLGGDAIRVRVVDVEPYSEEAELAKLKYGIEPQSIISEEDGGPQKYQVYMALAFTCGPQQSVLPFMWAKLPVEYELTRSIRSVAQLKRRKLGVLQTEVDFFGGFDRSTMQAEPEWEVLKELRYQYEIVSVPSAEDYPADIDALLAPMPSSLSQEDMDRLRDYIRSGGPTLILDDPLPMSSPSLAASERTVGQGGNPMMGGPQPRPKGDIRELLREFHIEWDPGQIAADLYNPFPEYAEMFEDRELVFISPNAGGKQAFNAEDSATSGLQEMVVIFGGIMSPGVQDGFEFTPLITTSPAAGFGRYDELLVRTFMGTTMNPERRHLALPEQPLAARVRGPSKASGAKPVHLVFIADLDLISGSFFSMRRQSGANGPDFNFDNIPFVLNCVDTLMGDESFVELRKRRPAHRTLEAFEKADLHYRETWSTKKSEAEAKAKELLEEAQARFDSAVKAVEANASLDERAKEIKIASIEDTEQRKLKVAKARIEQEKARTIQDARAERIRSQRDLRRRWSIIGWVASPILAVLFGFAVLGVRMQRERDIVPVNRRRADAYAAPAKTEEAVAAMEDKAS